MATLSLRAMGYNLRSDMSRRTRRFISGAVLLVFLAAVLAYSSPRVAPTERYNREMLRLMLAEANRAADELHLEEQLPITGTNLTLVWLIPAGKTYGPLGVIETRNYAYTMDVKDFGVVLSGFSRKGYAAFHEARAKYAWPMSRYDTNRAFQVAMELMTKAGMDVNALNRDCRIRIDAPNERGLLGRHFTPIFMVTWFQKKETFHFRAGQHVAWIQFIEPLKRIEQLQISDLSCLKYNLRKPLTKINFFELWTPENSREAVLNELEMATNYVRRIEDLHRGGAPESALREIWRDYSDAPFSDQCS